MLIEAVVLSIVIGWLRGGELSKFKTVREKTLWFVIIGILIQSSLVFLQRLIGITTIDKILTYTKEIIILSYLLIFIGVVMNYSYRALWISFFGYILNLLALFSNGWKKPVLMEGLNLTGNIELMETIKEKAISFYTPLIEGTKYSGLGNIIVFSNPYPLAKVVSIGDIIIGIGVFIFIQDIMFKESSFFSR